MGAQQGASHSSRVCPPAHSQPRPGGACRALITLRVTWATPSFSMEAAFQFPHHSGAQPRLSPQPHWQMERPPQWGGLATPGGHLPPPPPAFAAAGAGTTPPVFYTEAALTLDSPSSSGSPGHGGYGMHGPSPLGHPPPYGLQQHPPQPPPAPHDARQLLQLEQQNADLLHCCAELQVGACRQAAAPGGSSGRTTGASAHAAQSVAACHA